MNVEDLYEQHKDQIYSLCMKLTNSKELADDLFSDTWVRVAEKYTNIDKDRKAINWIYSVCINIYRKNIAKSSRIQTIDFKDEESMDYTLSNLTSGDTVESSLIQKEDMLNLKKALNNLNDKYRVPLVLFYFGDISYKEISQIMKLPLSTIKFRLNHGKRLLANELEEFK